MKKLSLKILTLNKRLSIKCVKTLLERLNSPYN